MIKGKLLDYSLKKVFSEQHYEILKFINSFGDVTVSMMMANFGFSRILVAYYINGGSLTKVDLLEFNILKLNQKTEDKFERKKINYYSLTKQGEKILEQLEKLYKK